MVLLIQTNEKKGKHQILTSFFQNRRSKSHKNWFRMKKENLMRKHQILTSHFINFNSTFFLTNMMFN